MTTYARLFTSGVQDHSPSSFELRERIRQTYWDRFSAGSGHRFKPSSQVWPALLPTELTEIMELMGCTDLDELYRLVEAFPLNTSHSWT